MKTNAESKGVQWSRKGDKRVTNIGKFLRSTRIDELPQLFSVLIGDMSLIGPRPERDQFIKVLRQEIPYYDARSLVKPGLSGWAQINGRNNLSWQEKFSLDIWYVKNLNFFLDFYIVLKTFVKVFTGDSVNSSKLVSMEPYRGAKE